MQLVTYRSYGGSTHVGAGARVGLITSKEGVMAAVKAYVVAHKGDESTVSYHALFNERAGGKGCLNKDDLMAFLKDADACAINGCGKTADAVISAMNTSGTGCVTWEEFRVGAGLAEEAAPPPAGPPSDPNVVDDNDRRAAALTDAQIQNMCLGLSPSLGGADGCRLLFEKYRANAQAKIAAIAASQTILLRIQPKTKTGPLSASASSAISGMSTTTKIILGIGIPVGAYALYRIFRPRSLAFGY